MIEKKSKKNLKGDIKNTLVDALLTKKQINTQNTKIHNGFLVINVYLPLTNENVFLNVKTY